MNDIISKMIDTMPLLFVEKKSSKALETMLIKKKKIIEKREEKLKLEKRKIISEMSKSMVNIFLDLEKEKKIRFERSINIERDTKRISEIESKNNLEDNIIDSLIKLKI